MTGSGAGGLTARAASSARLIGRGAGGTTGSGAVTGGGTSATGPGWEPRLRRRLVPQEPHQLEQLPRGPSLLAPQEPQLRAADWRLERLKTGGGGGIGRVNVGVTAAGAAGAVATGGAVTAGAAGYGEQSAHRRQTVRAVAA